MEIAIIIAFIFFGIIFLLIELFFIPGLSISGTVGVVLMLLGIRHAYVNIGMLGGNITLVGSILLSGLGFWIFYKTKTLEKISLKTNITGSVDSVEDKVKVGDIGFSISRLAPMGKVMIGDSVIEAKTNDQFIDQGTKIVIKRVDKTNVLVEEVV